MKKIIFLSIFGLMLFNLVSATPQVIFSSVNITIDANSSALHYRIFGEGIDASEILPLTLQNSSNCSLSFNYSRSSIPIAFSRDVCENVDTAVLIKALANNNNVTSLWMQCVNNLSVCQTGRVDTGNYSVLENQYNSCQNNIVQKDSTITVKDNEIKNLESQRLLIGGVAVACLVAAYVFWKKTTPKTLNAPGLSQLPRSQRI